MKNYILLLLLGAPLTAAEESSSVASPASLPAGPATLAATTTRTATTSPDTVASTAPSTVPSTGTTAGTTNPTTTTAASQPGPTPKDRFARVAPPPRSIAAAQSMPKDYALLISRSVFVHGRMPDISTSGEKNGGPITPPRPEKSLLFNGATNSDGELVAFIEDTNANRVLKLRIGDPVARGKVASITLDTFDYDASGNVKRVTLGQNLDGEAGLPTSRPAMAGSPGGSAGGSAPVGGAPLDILERLRQRRAQESGGK